MRDKGASVRWRTARPKLHIDDGCMGGGTKLDYVNPVNYDSTDGDPNFVDDYYNNPSIFATNRHHIFHYALFNDKCFADGDTDRYGRGGRTSDRFVICKGYATGDKEWKTFMHELGHNLEPSSKPIHLNSGGHHEIESCIMHATSWDGTDYCDTCWKSFSLSDGLK